MEQPNATGDGDAALTPQLWAVVVATGVVTGLLGAGLMWILYSVQHVAFGYHSGELTAAVERASDLRRVLSLTVAGVVGAGCWYTIRRFMRGERTDVDDVVWSGDARLGFRRSLATSVVSVVVVGAGASLGREAAPKLMGAASGGVLAGWAKLTPAQRRLVVACGGGAGLGAVYNVPLGGAFFAAELLCGAIALPTVLPALVCSWVATLTTWIYLPNRPTYVDIPAFGYSDRLMVWAVLAGPVIGIAAAALVRVVAWVSHRQVTGARILVALPVTLCALGCLGIRYPQLFGNGKDLAHSVFLGNGSLWFLFAIVLLKPLVTTACLGAGGSGGLFTPVLSTGAVLGGLLGGLWTLAWPGSPVGAYAMIGAAAMLGAAMQAPLTAVVLIVELTHGGFGLMVPLLAAVTGATALSRYVDGYSIYSARLEAR